jgi:hypothetical protein
MTKRLAVTLRTPEYRQIQRAARFPDLPIVGWGDGADRACWEATCKWFRAFAV